MPAAVETIGGGVIFDRFLTIETYQLHRCRQRRIGGDDPGHFQERSGA